VEVKDSGPSRGDLERSSSRSSVQSGRHRSGSGLGLTIVSAVVDDHKGVIDLDSNPDGPGSSLFPASAPPTSPSSSGVRV
jgi:nitrogen-specific signal transduction histidine kinase